MRAAVPCRASVGTDPRALAAAAAHHRVLVLLGSLLRAAGTLDTWPTAFIDAFLAAEREAVAIDCVRQVELTRVLAALRSRRIGALAFKGAALAHTHYAAPHLRPRTDTDLLVAAADVCPLDETFADLGYERQRESSGRLLSYVCSRTSSRSAASVSPGSTDLAARFCGELPLAVGRTTIVGAHGR